MKKFLLILATLSILLTMVACGTDTPTTPSTNDTTTTTTTPTTSTTSKDEPAPHEHTAGEWVIVEEAQKTVDGYKTQSCSECGEELARETLYATGSEGLKYTTFTSFQGETTCWVTGIGDCTDTEVYVPAYINGYRVTQVTITYAKQVTSITIAEGIQELGSFGFWGCENLVSVYLPDSLTTIPKESFFDCDNLIEIEIPKGVTTIGDSPFISCKNLSRITVDTENPNYQSIDGNLYTKDGTVLIQYAAGKTEESFVVPETVTKIGTYAFNLSKFSNIYLPSSLTEIGKCAFVNSHNLQSVNIPDGVVTISPNAFEYCVNLESVTIPESVTTIGEYAFHNCKALENIILPSGLTEISGHILSGCEKLKSITIPEGVTSIGEYAFSSMPNSNWYIPASVVNIDCTAFLNVWVAKFEVATENEHYQSIDGHLYTKDGKTLVRYAIANTSTSFTIPEGVTTIGFGAFRYVENLTSVTIPKTVTKIENIAFQFCYDIEEFIFEGTTTEWENIDKLTNWDQYCGSLGYPTYGYEYVVKCTDETITVTK